MASAVLQESERIGRGERPPYKATQGQQLRWHYRRGEREDTHCVAYRTGRAYHLRVVASEGTVEVHKFASAETLLNRHAVIERKLTAAGWQFVGFTHQR